MRQEKLRLLAATGSAEHRNAEISTGWDSQRGQQEKACRTARRLYREGSSPRKEGRKEMSGATVTRSTQDQIIICFFFYSLSYRS